MKAEFITKTVDIVSNLIDKGLLTEYTSQIKVDDDLNFEEFAKNAEEKEALQKNPILDDVKSVAEETVPGANVPQENVPEENVDQETVAESPSNKKPFLTRDKKEDPFRDAARGAGKPKKQFKKKTYRRRKYKNLKTIKKNKKQIKSKTYKKSSRKTRSYKKK
jgi:hypothetical protein